MEKNLPLEIIGRDKELSLIEKLLKEWDTRRILCISGAGGIGKTRLLQEIRCRFKTDNNEHLYLLIADIMDFDNPIFHNTHNFSLEIARQLGEIKFESYQKELLSLREMEMVEYSQERLARKRKASIQKFITCFNSISLQQRILLLFDTTDALQGKKDVWKFIAEIFPHIKNCLLIITGRDAGVIGESLKTSFDKDIQVIDLLPLNTDDSDVYLEQKLEQLYTSFESDVSQKLILLAKGKPILLDLAVEWRARNIPLDWLIKLTVKEFDSISDEKKEKMYRDFEYSLVSHIAEVHYPIDRVFLAMSRFYPLETAMLAELLNIPAHEAESLFEEAKTYTFVKILPDGRISLHDEMRRMVNEYLWKIVDPGGKRRSRDSTRAAKYLIRKIEELEVVIRKLKDEDRSRLDVSLKLSEVEENVGLLTTQLILHTLISDIEKGFSIYKDTFWKARDERKLRFAKELEEIIQPYISRLNPDQQYEFTILHGRLLNDTRKVQEAKKLFGQLLDENQGNSEREADIHNALSVSEINLGNYELALKHQRKSYSIIQWLKKEEYYSRVANKLGDIYKLRGEFKESLQYYRAALDAELQADSPDRNSVASILNNMGYVFGLEGEYNEGERFCQQAIDMWIYENLSEKAGEGEIALSTIFRDKGEYNNAITYLRKAITRFKEPDDAPWLVRAYLHSGWTQWYQSLEIGESDEIRIVKKAFENDIKRARRKRSLHLARDSFEKSLELAEKYHVHAELPLILGKYSNVCWLLDEKEKARRLINEAFELSKEYNDIYQAIDSLLVMAEFDYTEGKYDKIPDYAKILQDEYESKGYSYPLLFGRMRRFLADIAYEAGDYDKALHKYSEGIALINQHGGYSMYSIDYELESLKNKLDTLPAVKAYEWITHLKTYWKGKKPGEKYVALLNWCDQQLIETKFRER
ncbi:MAG: ATP-binding protein [Desulfobacterales bacterium]|nr:ATP-binding protein [Desulfobacterales bacterium]